LKLLHSLPPYNFAGIEEQYDDPKYYEKARFVVIPVPFDSTVSFNAGQRNGPHAIINASRFMELYDEELDSRPCDKGIFTTGELEPCRANAEETVNRIEYEVKRVSYDKKVPVLLGGEHLIALGAVRALKPDSVLALDAHADDYDEIEGSRFTHATWAKRASEVAPVTIVGVRSLNKKKRNCFGVDFDEGKVLKELKGRVYVSIDLDAFDPFLLPSVGTPEPGGLGWREANGLLAAVFKEFEVVGFDVCGLTPVPGLEAPNALAARLAYRMMGWKD